MTTPYPVQALLLLVEQRLSPIQATWPSFSLACRHQQQPYTSTSSPFITLPVSIEFHRLFIPGSYFINNPHFGLFFPSPPFSNDVVDDPVDKQST